MDFNLEFGRIVNALQISQKKGLFNLDEAAAVHRSIIAIQKEKLVPENQQGNGNTSVNTELKAERDQLVGLLEQYKNAIDEFRKQHENSLNQLRQQVEHNKELKQHMNTIQRENADLKKDLSEIVNMDEDDDEIIEVPDKKSKKKNKK